MVDTKIFENTSEIASAKAVESSVQVRVLGDVVRVGGGPVTSVNGKVGDVVLTAEDVRAADKYHHHEPLIINGAKYDGSKKVILDLDFSEIEDMLKELGDYSSTIQENKQAIEILNGDVETEGSIAHQVHEAIQKLISESPDAVDVFTNLKAYIDKQDLSYYEAIQSIEEEGILALFPQI